jgi:hypothetical protein
MVEPTEDWELNYLARLRRLRGTRLRRVFAERQMVAIGVIVLNDFALDEVLGRHRCV